MQKTTTPDASLLQKLTDEELVAALVRAKAEADAVAERRLFTVPPLVRIAEAEKHAAEQSRTLGAELDRLSAMQKFYDLQKTLGTAIRFILLGVKYLGKGGDCYKQRLDEIENRITFGIGAATSAGDNLDQLKKINAVLDAERNALLDLAGEIDAAITDGAVDPVMQRLDEIDGRIVTANQEHAAFTRGQDQKNAILQKENAAMKNLIQGGGK